MINNIGVTVLILSIAFYILAELEGQNPCSMWANNPSECNSDRFQGR